MAQIRDTDIIRTPEVTVDPRLFVPDGVIDVQAKSTEIDPDNPVDVPELDVVDETTGEGVIYDSFDDAGRDSTDNDTLPAPQSIEVVQQDVKFGPDGSVLVDVIIAVEEAPGITDYEVRVTKV
jgi:hypothetical protein